MSDTTIDNATTVGTSIPFARHFTEAAFAAPVVTPPVIGIDRTDPNYLTKPENFQFLTEDERLKAAIAMEKNGQVPMGNVAMGQEAQLAAAGFQITFDGQIDGNEAGELKKLEEMRNDTGLLKAGVAVVGAIAGGELERSSPGFFNSIGSGFGLTSGTGTGFTLGSGGGLMSAFLGAATGAQTSAPDVSGPAVHGQGFFANLGRTFGLNG